MLNVFHVNVLNTLPALCMIIFVFSGLKQLSFSWRMVFFAVVLTANSFIFLESVEIFLLLKS